MSPLGHHIRSRLEDNRVILRSAAERRVAARVVLQQGRQAGLLAFGVPDTHLHVQALCSGAAASRLSQRITSSLKQRLGLPVSFVTYPNEPIRDQRHLYYNQRYVLTQHSRHGLELATFFEASNLPDLLGARLLGHYSRDNLRRYLPRVRRGELLEWLGLPGLLPAEGPLWDLRDATLAATALSSLAGRSLAVVEARRAMLDVVGGRLGATDTAALLGVTRRAVRALRSRPVNAALVQAIRLQLALRQTLSSPITAGSRGVTFAQGGAVASAGSGDSGSNAVIFRGR